MSDVREILGGWQSDGIGFVRFELPDMHGISRSKTIPIAHAFDYAERGLNMYGGASVLDTRSDVVPGTLYHDKKGYGDQLLFPDPGSAAVIPWMDRTARFICDAQWYDATPLAATPRSVFRRALEKARAMGFDTLMGSEFEFYLLTGDTHEPLFDGYHIFNTVRNDYVPTIRRIIEEMPKVGVDIITANCEYARPRPRGPGRRLHVQERGQGDREAGRLPRDVHDETVGGSFGERVSHPPVAALRGLGEERVRRCRRPVRDDRHVSLVHRRDPEVRARVRRGDRSDRE